jgi:hypothetical protein
VRVDAPLAGLLARIAPIFALGEAGMVSGTADLEVRLEGRGADWEAVKPNLAGTGVLQVTDGGVAGAGLVGEVLEVLSGTRDLSFSGVRTEFAVRDGRVWNERLTVDGKEHAMVLKGSTSFDGVLDYDLSARAIKMGKKKRERFAGVLDADGNLPFGLGGSLSKPRLKPPDLKKVLGGALEDLLKRKAGGLFGGGDD